jgi:hypothetical protein
VKTRDEVVNNITSPLLHHSSPITDHAVGSRRNVMSYLIELQMPAGSPGYIIADGDNREDALAHVHEQLGMDDEDEIVVLGVHTVH